MDLGAAGRAPGRGAGVVAAGLADRPAAAGRRPPGLPLGRAAAALGDVRAGAVASSGHRSEEHTSELQSLMRISYAVFCLKKKTTHTRSSHHKDTHEHTVHTPSHIHCSVSVSHIT